MRQRLLLVLMLGLVSMGAECSDGGNGGSAASHHTSFATTGAGGPEIPPTDNLPGSAVPEPSAALVFGAGLLVAGVVSRRQKR
jgi:PEP-CTERM motif-containing protein